MKLTIEQQKQMSEFYRKISKEVLLVTLRSTLMLAIFTLGVLFLSTQLKDSKEFLRFGFFFNGLLVGLNFFLSQHEIYKEAALKYKKLINSFNEENSL